MLDEVIVPDCLALQLSIFHMHCRIFCIHTDTRIVIKKWTLHLHVDAGRRPAFWGRRTFHEIHSEICHDETRPEIS